MPISYGGAIRPIGLLSVLRINVWDMFVMQNVLKNIQNKPVTACDSYVMHGHLCPHQYHSMSDFPEGRVVLFISD